MIPYRLVESEEERRREIRSCLWKILEVPEPEVFHSFSLHFHFHLFTPFLIPSFFSFLALRTGISEIQSTHIPYSSHRVLLELKECHDTTGQVGLWIKKFYRSEIDRESSISFPSKRDRKQNKISENFPCKDLRFWISCISLSSSLSSTLSFPIFLFYFSLTYFRIDKQTENEIEPSQTKLVFRCNVYLVYHCLSEMDSEKERRESYSPFKSDTLEQVRVTSNSLDGIWRREDMKLDGTKQGKLFLYRMKPGVQESCSKRVCIRTILLVPQWGILL